MLEKRSTSKKVFKRTKSTTSGQEIIEKCSYKCFLNLRILGLKKSCFLAEGHQSLGPDVLKNCLKKSMTKNLRKNFRSGDCRKMLLQNLLKKITVFGQEILEKNVLKI